MTGVSPDVLGVLTAHDYPGNVRELQNIIEHAFVLLHEGQIELEHLPGELVPVAARHAGGRKMIETVKALEAQAIREALERNGGNRLAAARELGMHKSTLFRKIRLLGIGPSRAGRPVPRPGGIERLESRVSATVGCRRSRIRATVPPWFHSVPAIQPPVPAGD